MLAELADVPPGDEHLADVIPLKKEVQEAATESEGRAEYAQTYFEGQVQAAQNRFDSMSRMYVEAEANPNTTSAASADLWETVKEARDSLGLWKARLANVQNPTGPERANSKNEAESAQDVG